MRIFLKIIVLFLLCDTLFARDKGETEITTEDGIEVYQEEKYYLLKKNVKIDSDNFILNADFVKIKFNESMYDIIELDAKGNVSFISEEYNVEGDGETLNFIVDIEKIKIEGLNSELLTNDIKMFSDGSIEVNNLDGDFYINGANSKLINDSIYIEGEKIDGIFSDTDIKKEIIFLNVFDNELSYVKNKETEMYAKKIKFDNSTSLIELFDNVTIIRNEEKITGDYGTLDTKNNSYKIKSNNKTKVKAIIQSEE